VKHLFSPTGRWGSLSAYKYSTVAVFICSLLPVEENSGGKNIAFMGKSICCHWDLFLEVGFEYHPPKNIVPKNPKQSIDEGNG
jgi:hypothetical protein